MRNKPLKKKYTTVISGGGPAGMVAGLLLARAGVDVVVFEKHIDFLRDFRGDTVHPSTLQILDDLGMLEDFLKLPHQKGHQVTAYFEEESVVMADFKNVKTPFPYIAFMPQWDFLNFLADRASRYPNFQLKMQAEVTGLIEQGDKVVGVKGYTPEGPLEVLADLVLSADGRRSTLRDQAGLKVIDRGAPMDVLWMRLSRKPKDPEQPRGRIRSGAMLVMLDRGDYWQCAFLIAKGTWENIQKQGLDAFRVRVATLEPLVADRMDEIKAWDQVKLLTVKVDYLEKWYRDGLLCIGDAAHAMSPIGGVGINLAVQDAVAVANLLAKPLLEGKCTERSLHAVQKRRAFPARVIQRFQVAVQNQFLSRLLEGKKPVQVPLVARLIMRFPYLRRFPARFIGIGVRPERVAH